MYSTLDDYDEVHYGNFFSAVEIVKSLFKQSGIRNFLPPRRIRRSEATPPKLEEAPIRLLEKKSNAIRGGMIIKGKQELKKLQDEEETLEELENSQGNRRRSKTNG